MHAGICLRFGQKALGIEGLGFGMRRMCTNQCASKHMYFPPMNIQYGLHVSRFLWMGHQMMMDIVVLC